LPPPVIGTVKDPDGRTGTAIAMKDADETQRRLIIGRRSQSGFA
jgi:hypothetical protein